MQEKFDTFRQQYPTFVYKDYHIEVMDEYVLLTFDFEIPGLKEFHPTNKIRTTNLKIVNGPDSLIAREIAFSLGMVELVSYWKSTCSPLVEVQCGQLDSEDCDWWKKLYYNGLGEFMFKNDIEVSFDDFMTIKALNREDFFNDEPCFDRTGKKIVPVGGGKDSNVTMELLKNFHDDIFCFTVNDQPARGKSAACAGYTDDNIIRTFRTIDKSLLEVNGMGFLNGHTPFSAIVAFLSSYCAYLIGAEFIVLSNESSANESNIEGTEINHQYSKSYEFEMDFNTYFEKNMGISIKYFSILRAFNELQIAKQFAAFTKYHPVFKSCNVGSKKNIWCCNCAKCLFVYIILSPFLRTRSLYEIFGENLLDKVELKSIFDGLVGFSSVKPFECIGTKREINAALLKTCENMKTTGESLPFLLDYYYSKVSHENDDFEELLKERNEENLIPDEFKDNVEEMYAYVSSC